MSATAPRLLDRKRIADELGVTLTGAETVMRACDKVWIGRRVYIERRELESYLNWFLWEIGPEEGRYEELVLTRGGFPGGVQSHNSMLFYLKQQPLQRFLKNFNWTLGLVTGIRKQESSRRMGAGISVPIRPDGRKVWVSPILEWSKVDCGRLIERDGLARNRVVDLIHRSGECLCGALARQEERLEIAEWFPDVNRRINQLERECERRGILASVWAGRNSQRLTPGQQQMFSSADFAPLCTSCEANA